MNTGAKPKYSVVIPVYNSEAIIAETVRRTAAFFTAHQLDYEIILVNDGSRDNSWIKIKEIAKNTPEVISINLLRNYGQHNANLCGFRAATGDWVITIDDDLQNPPEEIIKLIRKADEGYELIIGKFKQKKHAFYRRIGSKLINRINKSIFNTPDNIILSNYRLISREVVDRVCEYQSSYPYIPGLVVMFSHSIANTEVEHHDRQYAQSNYSLTKILSLVATILFNYSSYPLRLTSYFGIFVAFLSFLFGSFYLLKGLLIGTEVQGWITMVVLISIFSGIIMAMLAMIGEYLVRLINQTSSSNSYIIKERVGQNES